MNFFFSSRRRHTRYWRDWSSDVCSSDLDRPDHGDVHRARDDPLRILRLLAVVRGHFEADPRPEGEEETDSRGAGGELAASREARERLYGVQRRPLDVLAPLAEDGDVHDEQDDHLADERDPEHPGREADVEIGEDRDQRDHPERKPGPGDVRAPLVHLRVREEGEAAGKRRFEDAVSEERCKPARHPELTAETVADERVEPARDRKSVV